jgi:hypothetical protein
MLWSSSRVISRALCVCAMRGSPHPSPSSTSMFRRSGVPGPLRLGMHGDSEVTLLLLPREGVAASAGGTGILARTAGDKVILVLGDMPKASSFIGLSVRPHESRGIKRAGYRFRLDLVLTTLLRLEARLFRLESVAKVVGSLVSEGQVSSLKMVPFSLPPCEL